VRVPNRSGLVCREAVGQNRYLGLLVSTPLQVSRLKYREAVAMTRGLNDCLVPRVFRMVRVDYPKETALIPIGLSSMAKGIWRDLK
jgi:hypothetical protein